MKKIATLCLLATTLLTSYSAIAQDKSKRPSPPAEVTATTKSGLTITINYSQPSVKGRTIGQDIAPYNKVWRTGANEATTFEISKDASIEGRPLPAGKYSLYTIPAESEWKIIFNKTSSQWGTAYKEADDALRVNVKAGKAKEFTEKMTFTVSEQGKVTLLWGDVAVNFTVK
ncbi:MAG: hypothetical protein JWQ96_679 [Segetibacter sp.]|nr:hypothetical protein [Segetibacter sp.]